MKNLLSMFVCLAIAASARAEVLVVDGAGAGAFGEIQAAIDTALDGDIVLVRPGDYQAFTIQDLRVSVFAEQDGRSRCGQITILDLGPGKEVVIAGMDTQGSVGDGARIEDCLGDVRLQHCYLRAVEPDALGARISASEAVTIVDSTCRAGLSAVDSSLAIYGAGGFGGIEPAVLGTTTLESSFLFVSGAELRGADGESNHYIPGDGTDGLRATGGSEVWSVDGVFTAGLAGDCLAGSICSSADDGEALFVSPRSTFEVLAPASRQFSSRQSIGADCLALTFTGELDDGVFVVGGGELDFEFVAERAGVRSIAPPVGHTFRSTSRAQTVSPFPIDLSPPFMGRIPASGVLRVPLDVLGAGAQGELVHLQAVFVTETGEHYWGSPLSVAILPVPPVDCDADGVPDACAIANDPRLDMDGNGFLDACQGRLFVDGSVAAPGSGLSWDSAFRELRDALAFAAARPGVAHEVWIAQGTYHPVFPDGSKFATFEPVDGVALIGGFAGGESTVEERDLESNESVLCGDIAGDDGAGALDDNSEQVVTIAPEAAALFDGITISGGNALETRGGAGVYVQKVNGRDPVRTFRNCRFRDNRSLMSGQFRWGGAVRLYGDASFEGCVFENNAAFLGGAVDGRHSGPLGVSFTDCVFRDNVATHTGAGCNLSFVLGARFERCLFEDNVAAIDGGAIRVSTCRLLCVSSRFIGNTAGDEGGAVMSWRGDADFANTSFVGNACGDSGAAIHFDVDISNEYLTLVGCTVVGNATQDAPGAVRVIANSGIDVHDSIFWKNTHAGVSSQTAQLMLSGGSIAEVTYSCLQNLAANLPGHDNIDLNPRFVDLLGPDGVPATGDEDLRLAGDSPCVDAGDNARLPADVLDVDGDGDLDEPLPFDLDGLRRRQDDPNVPDTGAGTAPIVDMGAYERQ